MNFLSGYPADVAKFADEFGSNSAKSSRTSISHMKLFRCRDLDDGLQRSQRKSPVTSFLDFEENWGFEEELRVYGEAECRPGK